MAKQVKYPYRVHITKNVPGQEPERLAFQVDGILFIGTRTEDHTNAVIYEGKHWTFLTAQTVIERICLGKDADYIVKLKGYMSDLFDALLAESKEGAKA